MYIYIHMQYVKPMEHSYFKLQDTKELLSDLSVARFAQDLIRVLSEKEQDVVDGAGSLILQG